MKRALTILSIILLAGVFLYACGIIPNTTTSIVTIKIGDDPNKALLKAEAATPWTRMKNFLAAVDLVPSVHAYIPSVVQSIVVTVTAADLSTPIVGVKSVNNSDTTAAIRIDVPNGKARNFLVEGYRGIDSQVYYSGTATADLSGAEVTLPITMSFVGPGIWVSPTGSDTSGTGTQANPYLTIAKALSASTGTDAILVSTGTYTLTVGAAAPTLQLGPANALICLGDGVSTVIDASSTVDDLIYGNDGASIDNCKLIPGSDTTAIDDRRGAQTPTRIKVNGVLIDANQAVGGALDGIMLSADSMVLETVVLNTTWHGINVQSGKPVIQSSTISRNPTGIFVAGGEPTISDVTVSGDPATSTGIDISTTGKPSISGSLITNNLRGISITNGSPVIRSSTVTLNNTGVYIATSTGSNPDIRSNSIYCNTFLDADIGSIDVVDLRDNAWDHDTMTSPTGPIVSSGNCFAGDDICIRGTTPLYTPFLSAVSGGCL